MSATIENLEEECDINFTEYDITFADLKAKESDVISSGLVYFDTTNQGIQGINFEFDPADGILLIRYWERYSNLNLREDIQITVNFGAELRQRRIFMFKKNQQFEIINEIDDSYKSMTHELLLTNEKLRKYPKMHVQIVTGAKVKLVKVKQQNVYHHEPQFEQQLNVFFNKCIENGDIRLKIVPKQNIIHNNNSNNYSPALNSPPVKKRKLNLNYKSNVKNNNSSNSNNSNSESQPEIEAGSESENENQITTTEAKYLRMGSLMLQSASPVFEAMFTVHDGQSMKEVQTKEITIHCDSQTTVHEMCYFICTNQLPNAIENIFELVALAHYYQLKSLVDKCRLKMIRMLTVETFVSTVHCFNRFEFAQGYDQLCQFGHQHLSELKSRDDYSSLPYSLTHGALSASAHNWFENNKK